jgi:hypothetical protein
MSGHARLDQEIWATNLGFEVGADWDRMDARAFRLVASMLANANDGMM